MANNWKIPAALEAEIRRRDTKCVYCGVRFDSDGTRKTSATWEHIVNDSRIISRANIALSCSSCNASKGAKLLEDWLQSDYCQRRGIDRTTVAEVVQQAFVDPPGLNQSFGTMRQDSDMTEVTTTPTTWIAPYVPDADMLAALGEVVLRHAHLDHMLKMTIKSLLGITVDEALADTRKNPSWKLRKRIEDEARARLGNGDNFDRLSELLERCRDLSERRNRFAKDIWAVHLSEPHVGTQAQLGDDLVWRSSPLVEEVRDLAASIESTVDEITDARLHGWLADAIKRSDNPAD